MTLKERFKVAYAYGYLDAKTMVHLYETNGYPLEESAATAAARGLKIDKNGIEHELLMIGTGVRTAVLMAERAYEAWRLEIGGSA